MQFIKKTSSRINIISIVLKLLLAFIFLSPDEESFTFDPFLYIIKALPLKVIEQLIQVPVVLKKFEVLPKKICKK